MKIYNLNFPWNISASKQLPHRSINKLDLKDCFYIELKLSLFYIETRKKSQFFMCGVSSKYDGTQPLTFTAVKD